MRTDGESRSSGGLRLALGVVGLAIIGVGAWRVVASRPAGPDLSAAAPLKERITAALASAASALEPQATAAAALPELGAAWKMRADRATFQDLLENEEWWGPYRTRFPLSGVVTAGGVLGALGPAIGEPGAIEAVRTAIDQGRGSGVLATAAGSFLVAAARLPPPKSRDGATGKDAVADAPIVLLGAPLDQAVLQTIAGQTGDVIGLSNGVSLLTATGPPASQALAASLVGREGAVPVALAEGRVGVARPLGEHTWLLAISPPVPPPPRDLTGVWIATPGIALLFGAIAMRGRRAPSPAPARSTPSSPPLEPEEAPRERTPAATPARPPPTQILPSGAPPAAGAEVFSAATSAMPASDEEASRPTKMGRYTLVDRIGEGGMAEIFFAAAYGAENFVRHFVLKRMHPHLSRQKEAVNQFIDEARLQAGLVHSNIVPVFDFGKAGDEFFMALEYIHGPDLSTLVQRHVAVEGGALPLPVAFFILHEVLEALSFAHEQRSKEGQPLEIVHRDVAPGNVLISYLGEVKLTDFGIAKAERRVSRTEIGTVKGNAHFMSPEQARGEEVDLRTDIFSAGVLLFYCLTGQWLYQGEATFNSVHRAAVGPITQQFSQIDQLPPEAGGVLRRAIAQAPADRYQSADDFKREVGPHAADRAELARLMAKLFPVAERRDLR
jgi:hypothetical protein